MTAREKSLLDAFDYQCECNLSYVREQDRKVVEIGQGHLRDLYTTLLADNERLETCLRAAKETMDEHHTRAEALAARVKALEEALSRVEWAGRAQGMGFGPHGSGGDGPRFPACPVCRGVKPGSGGEREFSASAIGHKPDCTLRAALSTPREETTP